MTCARAREQMAALLVDGDEELKHHLSECAACRREAEGLERTLKALGPLGGALPAGDDLFLAAVRRGYAERRAGRGRGRWRIGAFTIGLAAAAALAAMISTRSTGGQQTAPVAPIERADDGDFDDDPCELIGDLDHDEVDQVQARFGKGA